MSDQEFEFYRKLVYERSGIALNLSKKPLLEARLGPRLRELGMHSFHAYFDYITNDASGKELVCLLDRVSTNETRFFREHKQFELVERYLVPSWIAQVHRGERPPRIRAWSAGCSTGEEAYSLAMVLLYTLSPAAGWETEIIATDLSSRALQAAETAVWPIEKASEIPDKYLKRFMLRGTGSQAGAMKAGPELRSVIHFQRMNLNDEPYTIASVFEMIFCRNVLIYFDGDSRMRVICCLVNHLASPGYLFVGHAESLNGVCPQLNYVIPNVYRYSAGDRATDKLFPKQGFFPENCR